jgi:Cu2+-containing amine oxidase
MVRSPLESRPLIEATPIRLVLFIALLAPAPVVAQSVTHPRDGLATAEYWIVYDALQSAGHLTPETKFTSVLLRPPAKATVLAWKRSAFTTSRAPRTGR